MTLQEYISFWQETYDKHQSRPTTYAAHNYVFKNHILPSLGDIPLSELTSEMVGEFLEERRRFGNHRPSSSGLGEETMRHIHRLLQQCLDQAMRDGLIGDNPARAFHYSKPKKVNADVLTPLEMEDYPNPPEYPVLHACESSPRCSRAYAPAPSTPPDALSPIGLQRRQLPGPFRVSSASQTEVLCTTEYP